MPAFSKVFETVVYDPFISFSDKIKYLSESQFGFRRHKGTRMRQDGFVDRAVNCSVPDR